MKRSTRLWWVTRKNMRQVLLLASALLKRSCRLQPLPEKKRAASVCLLKRSRGCRQLPRPLRPALISRKAFGPASGDTRDPSHGADAAHQRLHKEEPLPRKRPTREAWPGGWKAPARAAPRTRYLSLATRKNLTTQSLEAKGSAFTERSTRRYRLN